MATAAMALGCAVAALAAASAPAAWAQTNEPPLRPSGATGPLGDERLSDEFRITRFAGAASRAQVRARPDLGAPAVGQLHYLTEDGPYEVYPVLESRIDTEGRTWLLIRLPMRPNGRVGWVVRDALGPLQSVRTALRVDRSSLRATLYRDGRAIWSARVGIGKPSTPTPAGHFWIRSRLRGLRGDPIYGPYAFGTSAYSVLTDWPGGGVVGIHGTDQPGLIPGRPSHGCIRLRNADATRLWRLMPIGTPVAIV